MALTYPEPLEMTFTSPDYVQNDRILKYVKTGKYKYLNIVLLQLSNIEQFQVKVRSCLLQPNIVDTTERERESDCWRHLRAVRYRPS